MSAVGAVTPGVVVLGTVDLKVEFEKNLNETVFLIGKEAISTLVGYIANGGGLLEMLEKHVVYQQDELKELHASNLRVSVFFTMVMGCLNGAVTAISQCIKSATDEEADRLAKDGIARIVVECFALSHVKALVEKLDAIDTSIVDDAIKP